MVQSRSEDTKNRVLEAACALLMEQGISEMTMKDVQERSGVSNGSIFHHFGSKDGILEALFVAERRAYLGSVGAAIIAHEGDPCDAFGAGAAAAVLFHARDPRRYMRLIAAFSNSEWLFRNEAIWAGLVREVEAPVMQWALPHFQSGTLPMLPPGLFQSYMLGPPEQLTQVWVRRGMPGKLEDYAPIAAQFVSAGLRALREAGTVSPGS
ncbi:MAG: TetR/AcrR family transcriptional regulator [Novosphingobium sp.]|jgi:AcrR family transcriptional regulator|uniref:TetR/AcrR family transcriptional regulator n=1 Tax=Novosphingobium sp. TaxID=1874826 RepID=UPI00391A005A|nr:TetR/AcrR family transcriptional regulator [Novosphingobium sp.]